MKPSYFIIMLAGLAVAAPAISRAQVAGSTFFGSTYERVGSIHDVIVTLNKSISYAIVNAAAFSS